MKSHSRESRAWPNDELKDNIWRQLTSALRNTYYVFNRSVTTPKGVFGVRTLEFIPAYVSTVALDCLVEL
jgi:hypothetical protein